MSAFVCLPVADADQHVAVNATATAAYAARKFDSPKPRPETYVFMQGNYFDGTTIDRSIETMPFRRIAEYLAVDLAKQQYFPTQDAKTADLLIVVHWGTTRPVVTTDEMRSHTTTSLDNSVAKTVENETKQAQAGNDGFVGAWLGMSSDSDQQSLFEMSERETDNLDQDFKSATNARLLGYGKELRRLQKSALSSAEENTLRSDLAGERYFIILRAYDLHRAVPVGQTRPAEWTLHLNIRSPGHNFPTALNLMGTVAADYFGRSTDGVKTVRSTFREGNVTLGPLLILGEAK